MMQNITTNKSESEEARASDFGLVAALVTSGFGIRRTEHEGLRVHFIFEKTDSLENTIRDYWAGALKVYARQYFDNTKMLKSRIYNE